MKDLLEKRFNVLFFLQYYTSQPQYQQQLQYSSAADVSSFSYTSPVVAYNNQGLLRQLAGKETTPSHGRPVVYNSAPAAPKQQYQSSPKVQYVSQTPSEYTSSQNAYSAPSPSSSAYSPNIYSQSQNAYSATQTGPSQNAYSAATGQPSAYTNSAPTAYSGAQADYDDSSNAYQQLTQKGLFTSNQGQPQAVTYQSGIAGQKYSFIQSPAPQEYQSARGQQASYVQSGAQQYSSAPQASSAVYETAAQSSPQVVYSQRAAQPQYYSSAPQSKYAKPGITYV